MVDRATKPNDLEGFERNSSQTNDDLDHLFTEFCSKEFWPDDFLNESTQIGQPADVASETDQLLPLGRETNREKDGDASIRTINQSHRHKRSLAKTAVKLLRRATQTTKSKLISHLTRALNSFSPKKIKELNSHLKRIKIQICKAQIEEKTGSKRGIETPFNSQESFPEVALPANLRFEHPRDLAPKPKKPRVDKKKRFGSNDIVHNPDSLSNNAPANDFVPSILVRRDHSHVDRRNIKAFQDRSYYKEVLKKIETEPAKEKYLNFEPKPGFLSFILHEYDDLFEIFQFIKDDCIRNSKSLPWEKWADEDAATIWNSMTNEISSARSLAIEAHGEYMAVTEGEQEEMKNKLFVANEKAMKEIKDRIDNNRHAREKRARDKNIDERKNGSMNSGPLVDEGVQKCPKKTKRAQSKAKSPKAKGKAETAISDFGLPPINETDPSIFHLPAQTIDKQVNTHTKQSVDAKLSLPRKQLTFSEPAMASSSCYYLDGKSYYRVTADFQSVKSANQLANDQNFHCQNGQTSTVPTVGPKSHCSKEYLALNEQPQVQNLCYQPGQSSTMFTMNQNVDPSDWVHRLHRGCQQIPNGFLQGGQPPSSFTEVPGGYYINYSNGTTPFGPANQRPNYPSNENDQL